MDRCRRRRRWRRPKHFSANLSRTLLQPFFADSVVLPSWRTQTNLRAAIWTAALVAVPRVIHHRPARAGGPRTITGLQPRQRAVITRAATTSALLPLLRAARLVREDRRTTGASYVTASASPRWFDSLPRESAVSTKQSMVKADRSALAWAKWIMLMVAPTAQAQLATCGDADGEGAGTAAVSDAECGTGLIYNSAAASGVCAGLTCDVAADQTACSNSVLQQLPWTRVHQWQLFCRGRGWQLVCYRLRQRWTMDGNSDRP